MFRRGVQRRWVFFWVAVVRAVGYRMCSPSIGAGMGRQLELMTEIAPKGLLGNAYPAVVTSMAGSKRSIGNQQRRDGHDQYFYVERHRPIACVIGIAGDALAVRRCAAAADLPQPGYSRSTGKVCADRTVVPLQFLFGHRARANDAHVAPQNVEQLRQLVQA